MGKTTHKYLKVGSQVKYWLMVAILAMAVLVGGCSTQFVRGDSQVFNKNVPAPIVGRSASDFSLIDLDGNQFVLSEQLGKTVFINFWATWCPPCRAEMPEIEEIYQKYKDEDVVVIGVDVVEPEDTVRSYIEAGNFDWTFAIDTTGEVSRNYEVAVLPESFFIDKEGIIQAIGIGALSFEIMEAKLALAMN